MKNTKKTIAEKSIFAIVAIAIACSSYATATQRDFAQDRQNYLERKKNRLAGLQAIRDEGKELIDIAKRAPIVTRLIK